MMLTPREKEKLWIYVLADLARKRRARGTLLNYAEAIALISEAILEGARDGKSVTELMDLGRTIVSREDCMEGVADLVPEVHVEGTFPDGTKLVTCHDPIQ
jgi:urease subunit gamma